MLSTHGTAKPMMGSQKLNRNRIEPPTTAVVESRKLSRRKRCIEIPATAARRKPLMANAMNGPNTIESGTSIANGPIACWASNALPAVRCVFQSVSP